MLDSENEASRKEIENLNKLLEEKKANEAAVSLKLENLKISHSSVEQKAAFINENIQRLSEINSLDNEKKRVLTMIR